MEEALIIQKLKQLYRQYRRVEGFYTVSRFFIAGILAASAFLLLLKLTGFFPALEKFFPLLILLTASAGYILHIRRKFSMQEVALLCDTKLQLKERLSTAYEWIYENRERTPMFRGLLRDTAKASADIEPAEIFPLLWKKAAKKFAAASGILAICLILPSFSFLAPKINPREVMIIHKKAEEIETAAEKLKKKIPKNPKLAQIQKKNAQKMKKLAQDLKKSDISKKEALLKISKVQDDLNNNTQNSKKLQKMEEALKSARGKEQNRESDDNEKPFDTLAQKLKKMAQQAEKTTNREEKQRLLSQMEGVKKEMEKADMDTRKMSQAMENLQKGENQQAAGQMKELARQMEDTQEEMDMNQQMQEAAQSLAQSKESISQGKNAVAGNVPRKNMKKSDQKGPADFGDSTTNREEKAPEAKKNLPKNYTERFNKDKNKLEADYKKLYQPKRNEMETATTKIKGQIGQGPIFRGQLSATKGAPNNSGKVTESPLETYAERRAREETAIKKENIPAKYKNLVREYYDSIDPAKSATK